MLSPVRSGMSKKCHVNEIQALLVMVIQVKFSLLIAHTFC